MAKFSGIDFIYQLTELKKMTDSEFIDIANKHQLGHVAENLLKCARPALRSYWSALTDGTPKGLSYVGGSPTPCPEDWPQFDHEPMVFLGQMHTADLPTSISPVLLKEGVLQFYVCAQDDVLYDFPIPLGSGVVRFVEKGDFELSPMKKFVNLSLEPHPSIFHIAPYPDSPWLPRGVEKFEFRDGPDGDEWKYGEFRYEIMHNKWMVQMFGFADPEQDVMELGVETLDTNGMPEDATHEKLGHAYQKWTLLYALGDTFGRVARFPGNYYFWIKAEDLAKSDFSRVWMCCQFS